MLALTVETSLASSLRDRGRGLFDQRAALVLHLPALLRPELGRAVLTGALQLLAVEVLELLALLEAARARARDTA